MGSVAQFRTQEDGLLAHSVGMKSLVVGLGATGLAVARYLARDELIVIDSRSAPPGIDALRSSRPEARVGLGTLDPAWLDGVDRVVLSPGLSCDIPLAVAARRRGLPVLGDIELFAQAATAPILAVTGSNGKSTVVTLVAQILRAEGIRALAGGNLGPPALDLLREPAPDVYVLEISSFQMETTTSLKARAAAVLNVSADHLDRHGSLERYVSLKEQLLAGSELAVFNWDDPVVHAMGLRHAQALPFSILTELKRGYSAIERGRERWLARDLEPIIAVSELGLVGRHNESNALAALALCRAMVHEPEAATREALRRFTGLPHRCQRIAEKRGVVFVDDSKGTNVGATVAALEGMPAPVVLIAGGRAKDADFSALALAGRVRSVVVIGEAAPDIEAAFAAVCPVEHAASMADAVARAAARARRGDVVLLSPACASQDMFRDYRERGEVFVAAVAELPA